MEAAAVRKGKNGRRWGWSQVRAWVTSALATTEKELESYSVHREELLKIF